MKLGSAFQKINFLRDANSDFEGLGEIISKNMSEFGESEKEKLKSILKMIFKVHRYQIVSALLEEAYI